jgi:hypothetical protein
LFGHVRTAETSFRSGQSGSPKLTRGLSPSCVIYFADSLRRSEHGLAHRRAPATNLDQRAVHVTLDVVRRRVGRLTELG